MPGSSLNPWEVSWRHKNDTFGNDLRPSIIFLRVFLTVPLFAQATVCVCRVGLQWLTPAVSVHGLLQSRERRSSTRGRDGHLERAGAASDGLVLLQAVCTEEDESHG